MIVDSLKFGRTHEVDTLILEWFNALPERDQFRIVAEALRNAIEPKPSIPVYVGRGFTRLSDRKTMSNRMSIGKFLQEGGEDWIILEREPNGRSIRYKDGQALAEYKKGICYIACDTLKEARQVLTDNDPR